MNTRVGIFFVELAGCFPSVKLPLSARTDLLVQSKSMPITSNMWFRTHKTSTSPQREHWFFALPMVMEVHGPQPEMTTILQVGQSLFCPWNDAIWDSCNWSATYHWLLSSLAMFREWNGFESWSVLRTHKLGMLRRVLFRSSWTVFYRHSAEPIQLYPSLSHPCELCQLTSLAKKPRPRMKHPMFWRWNDKLMFLENKCQWYFHLTCFPCHLHAGFQRRALGQKSGSPSWTQKLEAE